MARLTVAEWAKTHGIQRNAAYKRLRTANVTIAADGTIDAEETTRKWNLNKDLRQQLRGVPKAKESAPKIETPKADSEGDDPRSLQNAQRAREWIRVGKEQILLQQLQGSVLPKQEVERAWSSMISAARARLLLLPGKIAPRLAVMTDVHQVGAFLNEAIEEALTALSEQEDE